MNGSVGNKVKTLVEKLYTDKGKGTKKDFSAAIGLKNHTYLHKLFLKDNLNTEMLNRIAEALNISVVDIINESSEVSEPNAPYGKKEFLDKKELEILRKRVEDLERIIKMQDRELEGYKSQLSESLKKKKH